MLEMNSFDIGNLPGNLDMTNSGVGPALSVRYTPKGTDVLLPGEAVVLTDDGATDSNNGAFLVDSNIANVATVPTYGVVVRSLKESQFQPGRMLTIATKGQIMYLTANESLNRGAKFSFVADAPGYVGASTGLEDGTVLDKATAKDDIIRVLIGE